jgi:hypothetical protein
MSAVSLEAKAHRKEYFNAYGSRPAVKERRRKRYAERKALGLLERAPMTPAQKERARLREKQRRENDPTLVLRNRDSAKMFTTNNPERVKAAHKRYEEKRYADRTTWARHMVSTICSRCKKKQIPFDITSDDILAAMPQNGRCPALDIPLVFGGGRGPKRNSASIDRIMPSLGYVSGNIAIISHKANSMKQDGTAEELRRVASWLDSVNAARNILALARSAARPAVESRRTA